MNASERTNKYITEDCPYCSQKQTFYGVELPCFYCNATGKIPNEEGLAIIELMRSYGDKYTMLKNVHKAKDACAT